MTVDWGGLFVGAATLYLLWQQNQIFKRQNEIFAGQAGNQTKLPHPLQGRSFRTYWPMLVMAALTLGTWAAIGYDYYDRRSQTNNEHHRAWLVVALILLVICLVSSLVMLYLEHVKHLKELEAVRLEAESKFAYRDESWRRWYEQQCEWSGTFMEKAGKARVLADEARSLSQMIENAMSDARNLGDAKALMALGHPLDPSPIRAIADSGPWEWYLRSLNRFQTAYSEHQARISAFPPNKKTGLCQFSSTGAAEMTADSVIKMISEHQKALLASASELQERYKDVISKSSSTPAAMVFDGYRGWRSHWAFQAPLGVQSLTVIYVRNNQLASAEPIYNVRARIDYLRDNRPAFSVDAALWWQERQEQGNQRSTSVDLEPNEAQCFAVFMEKPSDTDQPYLPPQSAVFVEGGDYASRSLIAGRWTARITVTADHKEPLCGEIEFTVYSREGDRQLVTSKDGELGAMRLPVNCY